MQVEFDYRGSPKVKRERWEPGRWQFGVSERIGTGATHSILSLTQRATAIDFLDQRALDYVKAGYSVTWHDEQRWFDATCEGQPSVFCVLQEANS